MLYEFPNAEQIKETYNQYIKAFQSGEWENSPFEVFGMQPKAGDTYNPQGYVNYVFNEDGQIAIIIDCDYAH
ncbi:MAG: hypothetical protein Q4B72_14855 [Lachnospiraceae bacterium]|nr:hypothetical protein [Lachnospiraceae bacterium]